MVSPLRFPPSRRAGATYALPPSLPPLADAAAAAAAGAGPAFFSSAFK